MRQTDAATIIRVGRRPPALAARGTFFDGRSARPRAVRLEIDDAADALTIRDETGWALSWPLEKVRRLPDQASRLPVVLHMIDDPLARLLTDDRRILARCPHAEPPVSRVPARRVALWAGAAMASVAAIILVLVPLMADRLARYLPPAGERALGEATFLQIRQILGDGEPVRLCDAPAGTDALARMTAALEAAARDAPGSDTAGQAPLPPLRLAVLDHPLVKAFALPGGRVVLFRGLLETAATPEELAAVVAHELGHVTTRDPTRHALRSAGSIGVLGLLLGDFAGGTAVLVLAQRLISARYSQAAERAADSFAHAVLIRAGVSPAALAAMFRAMRARAGRGGRRHRRPFSEPPGAGRAHPRRRGGRGGSAGRSGHPAAAGRARLAGPAPDLRVRTLRTGADRSCMAAPDGYAPLHLGVLRQGAEMQVIVLQTR